MRARCLHQPPIEEIIARSGKPHFSFRDLDENRPLASIRIRVETMHYFLKQYQEKLQRSSCVKATSLLDTDAYSESRRNHA